MHGIKNYSLSNRCPICGGPDWCGLSPIPNTNLYQNLCMRSDNTNDVLGIDGKKYIFVKSTPKGNKVYEEESQRCARIENYIKSNSQYNYSKAYKPSALTYENKVDPLPDEKLDAIYRDFLSLLVLENNHRNYLRKEGWSDVLINNNLVKSFPESDSFRYKNKGNYFTMNLWRKKIAASLVNKYGDLEGVPGAFKNSAGEWTFDGLGGIIFPLYNVKGLIYRLRVRIDNQFYDEKFNIISEKDFYDMKKSGLNVRKVGKYLNFSSYKEDPVKLKSHIISNIRDCGCAASSNIGYYMSPEVDDMYICYLTEGEKKGIYSNNYFHAPIISIPGVGTYGKLLDSDTKGKRPIDYMKEMGVHVFVIALDADKAVNEKVLESEKRIIEILRQEGFTIAVANWDASIGKGIDDLLRNGGRPVYEFAT